MTTEDVVRSLKEGNEVGHGGLILGAFLAKAQKGADIDFIAIGEAARERYGDKFELFCMQLRVDFKQHGFDLQAAARPQQQGGWTFYYSGSTGNSTTGSR